MTAEPAPVKLLVVDDEATLREPLAAYLGRQGFVVREADSAAAAPAMWVGAACKGHTHWRRPRPHGDSGEKRDD